jgi:hypothetical protein
MTNPLKSRSNSETSGNRDLETLPEESLAPIVAIGGLLTIKQVAQWYSPLLSKDKQSALPPSKRFLAPPKRGLGGIADMREELHERLEKIQTKLEGEKMLLVGHSLGGLMATMTAVERPDLVAGVVSLGGVHEGYSRDTPATHALKKLVGRHPEAGHLRHDSDFMLEHTSKMEKQWPKDVPLHVVSTLFDALIVPPQGFGVKIAHGAPEKRLVIPPVPGLESLARGRLGIGDDVQMLRSRYITEHLNLPRNPDIANYIDESRRPTSEEAVVSPMSRPIGELALAA